MPNFNFDQDCFDEYDQLYVEEQELLDAFEYDDEEESLSQFEAMHDYPD